MIASVLPVIVGLFLAALLASCQRAPDETQIRRAIDSMVAALETRDNRAFLEHVAESYRDHEGRDRQGLRQMLLANSIQHRDIRLLISGTTIELHGDRAEVRLQAQLTSGEQLIADRRFGAYRVRSLWRRQGAGWQVYQAEWEAWVGPG